MNFARSWIFGPIRYLEKNYLSSVWFLSDLDGFTSIIQTPIKYMLFFVCNGYGSVQIFRTQIKLEKHKYTRNTKNIQNLNKYLKIRKYSKDLKLYLKSDPRNQKIPKILSEYPNIFLKFDFLLEIQNYNRNFKPKLKNICIPKKYPKYTNIYNLHKYFVYFGSQTGFG